MLSTVDQHWTVSSQNNTELMFKFWKVAIWLTPLSQDVQLIFFHHFFQDRHFKQVRDLCDPAGEREKSCSELQKNWATSGWKWNESFFSVVTQNFCQAKLILSKIDLSFLWKLKECSECSSNGSSQSTSKMNYFFNWFRRAFNNSTHTRIILKGWCSAPPLWPVWSRRPLQLRCPTDRHHRHLDAAEVISTDWWPAVSFFMLLTP